MTIQEIFDRMMLYDNQLDLIAGGDDVTRGLTAINLCQDWWEAVAAKVAGLCQTTSTFTTTANQEHTTWPTTLRRIDSLWLLDSNSKPVRELDPIDREGGHVPTLHFPFSALLVNGSTQNGAPMEYRAQGQGGNIYWAPTPDAVYTIRGYGLWAVSAYTAAANTFGSPDAVALALVPFATKLMRIGLDRSVATIEAECKKAFRTVIGSLDNQVATGADSRVYEDIHDT